MLWGSQHVHENTTTLFWPLLLGTLHSCNPIKSRAALQPYIQLNQSWLLAFEPCWTLDCFSTATPTNLLLLLHQASKQPSETQNQQFLLLQTAEGDLNTRTLLPPFHQSLPVTTAQTHRRRAHTIRQLTVQAVAALLSGNTETALWSRPATC